MPFLAQQLNMDGTTYRVRIVYDTLIRSFELLEGVNAGEMLSGRHERDLLGTGYTYQMQVEPDPRYPTDYDAFFEAISAPVDSHTIIMPYGQTTITYEAMVESGQDTYRGIVGGRTKWRGLTVQYRYIEPQRVPETS
jgi:hypothetical protein|nr:MAG TPA: hypothetical protein [Bacteriophage sp.]